MNLVLLSPEQAMQEAKEIDMDMLKHKKFYFNPKNGQALGVICKDNTVSFGTVLLMEVATPGMAGIIMPQPVDSRREGWVEIPREEFLRLQYKYTMTSRKRKMGIGRRMLSWLKRKPPIAKAVLVAQSNTSAKPEPSALK